jgi:putative transcriptional regulator
VAGTILASTNNGRGIAGMSWGARLFAGGALGMCGGSNADILEAMALNRGPDKTLVALGYAGWGPGQLENEIAENSWLVAPASQAILFTLPPYERWNAAAQLIGIDMNLISQVAGHA